MKRGLRGLLILGWKVVLHRARWSVTRLGVLAGKHALMRWHYLLVRRRTLVSEHLLLGRIAR